MNGSTAASASNANSSGSHVHHDIDTEKIDRLLILYASETGNAQDCAERVAREVRRRGRRCTVLGMDEFDILELPATPLVIYITSTHGRGDPPPAMMPLWTALLRTSLPEDILEDVNFCLFGLGDSSYEKFAYAGKLLHRRLLALGANSLQEPIWGDERAPDGLEQAFLPWLKDTVEMLVPHLEAIPSFRELGTGEEYVLPEPIYRLEWISEMERLSLDENDLVLDRIINGNGNGNANGNGHLETIPPRQEDRNRGEQGISKPKDWRWARIRRSHRVTKDGWWQDVREIELEWDDEQGDCPDYPPGSICNLQPQSSPEEITDFITHNNLQEIADEPFRIHSNLPNQPLPPHLPPTSTITTLRSLLMNHLDIRTSPRKSFFEWLRRLSGDEREQERLDDFLGDPDEIHTYATRPRRTILETLADFRCTKIPISHILEILPPLRRRQFSIASSSKSHPGKVQLLIALVEYKTNLKISRRGLCSSWLQSLPLGTRIPIKITPPTLFLPPSPDTPVILVGPGTGVAPMRAFLEERVRQGAIHNTILYFGCRSLSADYYYAEEWEEYRKQGVQIRVAASRDTEEKVYVQHLIRRDKDLIKNWVLEKEGWVYISGSSNAMPREVRESIAWCISSKGAGGLSGMTEEESIKYVEGMFDQGRGGEESW